jgi:hypothetical protein
LKKTLDPTFKGAVPFYLLSVLHQGSTKKVSFKILQEAIVPTQIVFYFSKNFYLVKPFNRKIRQLQEGGLVFHTMSKFISRVERAESQHQKKLNLEQLRGVFQIYVFGLLMAISVFLVEIILQRKLFKMQG